MTSLAIGPSTHLVGTNVTTAARFPPPKMRQPSFPFGMLGRGSAHAPATVRPDVAPRRHQPGGACREIRRRSGDPPSRLGGSAHHRCRDDGPGISEALKQNMLEPFVRSDEARNMRRSCGLRPWPFDHQRHRNSACRHAVAARPAAAWTGGSDAIAGSPARRTVRGLEDDFSGDQAASASGCASS
jgi:hypothetical protein